MHRLTRLHKNPSVLARKPISAGAKRQSARLNIWGKRMKTRSRSRLVLGWLSLGILSLAAFDAGAQEIDDEADIGAIKAVIEQLTEAYVARDWDRFSGFFTEDAVWVPADLPPLTGKAAWWSFVEQFWDSTAVEEIDLVSDEIILAGDWAFERHTETTTTVPTAGDGEASTSLYKGVWLWHREGDGSWKIARYVWNWFPAPDVGGRNR